MIDKLRLFARFLFGILLVPIAFSVSIELYQSLGLIENLSKLQNFFLLGGCGYLIVHAVFYKPIYLYVLGHELTHAISSILCGGKVKSIKVSAAGGRVLTTKANVFTRLSPYLVPIYTVLLFLLYLGLSLFSDTNRYVYLFIFLVGFSLVFHIVLTIDFLKKNQPDILKSGSFFSLFLIYIVNICIIAAISGFIFSEISFPAFLKDSFMHSKSIYISSFRQIF